MARRSTPRTQARPRTIGVGLPGVPGVPGLVGLLGLLGLLGCGDGESSSGLFSSDLSGDLTINRAADEPLTFTPDVCLSGQREVFNGVSLYSEESELYVDVVDDPLDGLAVAITIPSACEGRGSCPPLVVRAGVCSDLRGEIFTNTRVSTNNIWHVEGWVSLRCPLPGGGVVFGELDFAGCH